MKKVYLSLFLACAIGGSVNAQINEGGLPWSLTSKSSEVNTLLTPKVDIAEPNFAKYKEEDEADARLGIAKPYRVAATVESDINTSNSGTWNYLSDGRKIWRLEISVSNAKALSLEFNNFNFPKGASLFITNENGQQVLGAYTSVNNNQYNVFRHEELQGNVAFLELNLEPNVKLSDLKFNIGKIYAYYRNTEVLEKLFGSNSHVIGQKPTDNSSPCHVNANCPAGNDPVYAKSKSASVQITMGGGVCSGTLINNTGNNKTAVCQPLMLTASHCEGTNSRSDAAYANFLFKFNYQYADCDATSMQAYQTRTGATFKARSNYPSIGTTGNSLVGDFLLLQLNSLPQGAANAYFSGWNRNTDLASNEVYTKFVGYHHPKGDPKKVSVSNSVDATGTFNQTVVNNTHWLTVFSVGGSEPGSSGSGLFDVNGNLVGDLSGGPDGGGACAPMGQTSEYSKLGLNWENAFDQTNFPAYAGAQSRLKDWLDPLNSNAMTLGAIKADCSDAPDALGVDELQKMLNNSINVYPNPSTNGMVYTQVNFANPTSFNITVTDLLGRVESVFKFQNITKGTMELDLKALSNGMHILTVSSEGASISRKITINN